MGTFPHNFSHFGGGSQFPGISPCCSARFLKLRVALAGHLGKSTGAFQWCLQATLAPFLGEGCLRPSAGGCTSKGATTYSGQFPMTRGVSRIFALPAGGWDARIPSPTGGLGCAGSSGPTFSCPALRCNSRSAAIGL